MDERRVGLHTVRRRRLTARGTKPVGRHQPRCENCYVYGAVAPKDGDGSFLGVPKLSADVFQVFVDEGATARPDTFTLLLVDNSRCHTAKKLVVPAHVVLLFQPPYAPQVTPAERGWQALKDALAWQCFPDLAHVQAHVGKAVQAWEADMLRSLTAYPFILDAVNALSP